MSGKLYAAATINILLFFCYMWVREKELRYVRKIFSGNYP